MTDTVLTAPAVAAPAPAAAPATPAAPAAAAPAPATFDATTGLPVEPAAGSPEAIAAAEAAAAAAARTPEEIAAEEQAAADAAKASAGAPEAYTEFTAPESTTLDPEVVTAFSAVARDLNLSQEKAQMLIDKVSPIIAQRQIAEFEKVRTAWGEQTAVDAEFGGVKFDESKVYAARAMKQFATPELTAMLNESGMGNHPELVRFMVRAGKAISEEKIITGGIQPPAAGTRSAADTLYPAKAKTK